VTEMVAEVEPKVQDIDVVLNQRQLTY